MKRVEEFKVTDKRVLVRCDFNVPVDGAGNVLDDFRIKKTLPTIQCLVKNGAKIILMSHLGEPNGMVTASLSLDKVKERLEELLSISIIKTDDCVGDNVQKQVSILGQGQVLLLENLRFHQEETDNDVMFAKKLSLLGDIYINDAFSDCHRAHASIVGIPKFLPSGAGLLLQREIERLNNVLQDPKKPMVALVGGIKVSAKAKFIEKISAIADTVIVNGPVKKEIMEKNITFTYPEKVMGPSDNFDALDINNEFIDICKEKILTAKTVVWNGPFGKFEDARYKKGTLEIAKAIIESDAYSVAGGGETVEFLTHEGMLDNFSHICTGGGAMLDYLSGEELPGLKALES